MNSKGSCISKYFDLFIQKESEMHPKEAYIPGRFVFRGLPNCNWGVLSSATRRLSKCGKMDEFIRYHINLVANARKLGYGTIKFDKNLTDLEILAEIQHYGGATCLVDFSSNFLIALWFAVVPTLDENGKMLNEDGSLIWMDLGHPQNIELINYCTQKHEIEAPINRLLEGVDIVGSETKNKTEIKPCYWIWEPKRFMSRIMSQNSIFLFGVRPFPQFFMRDVSDLFVGRIEISKEDKAGILKELSHFFSIRSESVFSDLSGYSLNANGISVSLNEDVVPTRDCIMAAIDETNNGYYNLALNRLDEAINLKSTRSSLMKFDVGRCMSCSQNQWRDGCCNLGYLLFLRAKAAKLKADENAGENYGDAVVNLLDAYSFFCDNYSSMSSSSFFLKKFQTIFCDLYTILSGIYYKIKDYDAASNFSKSCMTWCYDKNIEADYILFPILELSIMLNNKADFEHYQKVADSNVYRYQSSNAIILYYLFFNLGNAIFYQKEDFLASGYKELQNLSTQIQSKSDFVASGLFYWFFDDLKSYFMQCQSNVMSENLTFSFVKNYYSGIMSLIFKAEEAQYKLVNRVISSIEN